MISAHITEVDASVRLTDLTGVSLAGLIDEVGLPDRDATLGDLIEMVVAYIPDPDTVEDPGAAAAFQWARENLPTLVLVFSPRRPEEELFTKSQVNALLEMAAMGKITEVS
jgi:hypothetical protein